MGQQEVYDFLKRNKKAWFTSKTIAKKIKISLGSVTTSLKKLRQSGVLYYRFGGNRHIYEYRYKG